ncbi:acyl-CoA reductase-like NAD-dependent aldehyde dehydrogenase [Pseudomonas baetica]|nr:acyl-CoA reductase-like NAD-dependent aldehyde dehydrogenase [Pseudomonas baetica]
MADSKRFDNYINGEWVAGGDYSININPSELTDAIGDYAKADLAQVHAAIDAARAAFPAWSVSGIQARHDSLDKVGTEILARREELGTLLAREEGKTLPEAIGEVTRAGNIFKFFAGECLRLSGDYLPSVRPGVNVEVTREALGVVGLITPWNFPIAIPAWKIAPALAYGNCVVLKPADLVPGCAWALAEIISRAGFPAGVFNLVMGSGRVVGDALVNSPKVDGISFTGFRGRGSSDRGQLRVSPGQGPAGNGRQEPADHSRRRRPQASGRAVGTERVLLHRPALHRLEPLHCHRRHP